MESFFFLLGCVLLAFPIVAIVALVKTVGLNARLASIEHRMAAMESRPAAAPPATAAAGPPPQHAAPPIVPDTPQPFAARARPTVEPTRPPAPQPPEQPLAVTPPIAPQPAPAQPTISFEERLGTQWTVWVGGIALAFGGFFLVRYSIEQGYFGPGMRVFLGALLAAALIAAGEWARRSEKLSGITGLPSAHIPSILTAAGTAVAYADVYAAYVLYGFLGTGTAFVLLGVVAL